MPRLTEKEALEMCDHIADVMEALHRDIPEIFRRGEHAARDGYPSTSMGGDGGGSGISNPTEQAAMAPEMRDPIGSLIGKLKADLEKVDQLARVIGSSRAQIMFTAIEMHGRVSSVSVCRACDGTVTGQGEDRLVSGYCPACKQAWLRFMAAENAAGRTPASHVRFVAQRREYLAEKEARKERATA